MQQATTLSLLALVAALGGVAGTQLGRDAVSEIDPLFFSQKEEPTIIYPDPGTGTAPLGTPHQAAAEMGYPYPSWVRGPVCWGCPEQPNSYLDSYTKPYEDPLRGYSEDRRDTRIPTAGKAVVRVVGEDSPQDSVIDRYSSFPVTEDEVRRLTHIAELDRDREGSLPDDGNGQGEQTVGM